MIDPLHNNKFLTNFRQQSGSDSQKTDSSSIARTTSLPAGQDVLHIPPSIDSSKLNGRTSTPVSDPNEASRLTQRVAQQITRGQQQAAAAFGGISSGIVEHTLSNQPHAS